MWGSFVFEVTLPGEVDEQNIEANMDDGVLHVRVPKRSGTARRHIDVR
jgi:HSP20 family molecular chaperone IbpA